VSALGLGGIALLPHGAAPAAVTLSAVVGAANPPLSACLRAIWPGLLGDPDRLHAAYAMESVAQELIYILGPLLLVAGLAAHDPALATGAAALVLVAGSVAFAAHPASRGWTPQAERPAGRLGGVLRDRGVRVLVLTQFGLGISFGAMEVAVAAFADHEGRPGAAGWLLAVWGLGSMLGGWWAARRGAPADPSRHLAWMVAACALTQAPLALSGSPLVLALLLVPAGAAIAPYFATLFGLAGRVAPPGAQTETFTWLSTGIASGAAFGAAAAGALEGAGGADAGFVLAALAAAGAAAAAWAGQGQTRVPRTAGSTSSR
jgi:hypothetical protein